MIVLFTLLSLIGQSSGNPAITEENIYTALEPGQYQVGVRFVHAQDESRTVTIANEKQPRPIQITIWYPAKETSSQAKMTMADYLGYKASEFLGERQSAEAMAESVERTKAGLQEFVADKAGLDKVFLTETRAVLDAESSPGKFPLLLYAPSFGESPSENIALCEYLAGHGYVVASCPSTGAESREMTSDAKGIRAQAADLAFVLDYIKTVVYADVTNAGTFGYSWGGLANVLFAIDNYSIRAIASLDGSISVPLHKGVVSSIVELNAELVRVPLIFITSFHHQFEQDPHDFYFIDAAKNIERHIIKVHGVGHGNFSSSFVGFLPYLSEEVRRDVAPEYARTAYRAICYYLLKFFDAHLKGDPAAKEVFSQEPASNGFSSDLISIHHGKTGS